MPPATFLINLDRATSRLTAATAELDRAGWPFERIAAIDGSALDRAALHRIAPDPWSAYQGRMMTPGEVGCVASHRLAWQRLIDTGHPWGVVCEDDVMLGPDVEAAVRVFANQDFFDLVKLEGIVADPSKSMGARIVEGPPDIYLMETVSAGAAAYCVTRTGAGKLLDITKAHNREADFFIRQYGTTDLVVGEIRPFPARQDRRDSYIGASRLQNVKPVGRAAWARRFVRFRESLLRRWRFRVLKGFRATTRVSYERSSNTTFTRTR